MMRDKGEADNDSTAGKPLECRHRDLSMLEAVSKRQRDMRRAIRPIARETLAGR